MIKFENAQELEQQFYKDFVEPELQQEEKEKQEAEE